MDMDLGDLDSESQIDELGVKQLKVFLKRNCIDFKGCVEKQELVERVKRLWTARQKEKGSFFVSPLPFEYCRWTSRDFFSSYACGLLLC